MRVAAFFPKSLTAWAGRTSSVIYTAGCNFECKFCYAHSIVKNSENLEFIPLEKIESLLLKNFNEVQSIVLSGGEPLIQKGIIEFLEWAKAEGFEVKIDTNGSNNLLLEEIMSKNLVDYVAIDLKNQLNDYAYFKIIGKRINLEDVWRSVQAVKFYNVDHEIKMTFVPGLHSLHDLLELNRQLKGAKRFVLQQFIKSEGTLSDELENAKTPTYEKLVNLAMHLQDIDEVRVRTLKGDETIQKPITQKVRQIFF